nr:AAA family ATPase [Candidatus Vampirococcus lugosii]
MAKTKTITSISKIMSFSSKRIQFTPDMLPADIMGVEIFNTKTNDFEIKKGPVFTNILLADEINRTTPKVQSALLESMQEKQVSIGGETFNLPYPFFVLATQNPIEQEGTYQLPEAQLDRFLMKVIVDYPNIKDENNVLNVLENENNISLQKIISI